MKKKSIIKTIFVISVIAVLMCTSTQSYFSDTETSTGNTFTLGTIDLEIDPETGQAVETLDGHLDLKPCETGYITITLTNVGTNAMCVWKHIKDVECTEGVDPEPEEPEQAYYDQWVIDNPDWDVQTPPLIPPWEWWISDYIHYDLEIDWNNDGDFDDDIDETLIHEDDGYYITGGALHIECWYIELGILQPQQSIKVRQSYHLDASVENWAQSDIMEFTIEFIAQQLPCEGGPGPPGQILKYPNLPDFQVNTKFNYPGTSSYWEVLLSNIGQAGPDGPYNVWYGVWPCWCVDQGNTISNHANLTSMLYSSYDPNMPGRFKDDDWPKVNWIINNKGTANKNQIQYAIWEFIDGGYGGSDPVVTALIAGANSNPTYHPTEGENFAVIIDPGLKPDGIHYYQGTFIEVDP